jgi:hypothetical protein
VRRVVGWRLAVPLVCLLTGVLFTATRHAAAGYDLRGGRTTELSGSGEVDREMPGPSATRT